MDEEEDEGEVGGPAGFDVGRSWKAEVEEAEEEGSEGVCQ